MDLILHLLLLAATILIVAKSVPGVHVEGLGTALMVAIVYGLINLVLGSIFKILAIPFIFITAGLFLFVINAFLLWLTDQLLEDFEIEDLGTTFVAAFFITIADTLLSWIF
jgi:putative membrane protein